VGDPVVLTVATLGPTGQAAVRRLLDEFKARGWEDRGGAALRLVRVLAAASRPVGPRALAMAAPAEFFEANGLTRPEFARFLTGLSTSQRASEGC